MLLSDVQLRVGSELVPFLGSIRRRCCGDVRLWGGMG